jgi:hypothetical protein
VHTVIHCIQSKACNSLWLAFLQAEENVCEHCADIIDSRKAHNTVVQPEQQKRFSTLPLSLIRWESNS